MHEVLELTPKQAVIMMLSLEAEIRDETRLRMRLAGFKVEDEPARPVLTEGRKAHLGEQEVPTISSDELMLTADDIRERMASWREVANVTDLERAFQG